MGRDKAQRSADRIRPDLCHDPFTDEYHQDHPATDPVANVRFPKVFARSTLEKSGKKYHVISDQTRRDFEQRP
jgi:hypothetical protein